MEWNLDDSRSIWPQLREQILRAILSGEYKLGEAFPTVRELAQNAGVNRNTMQRAMAELENDGFLITNRTAGRTVTTDRNLVEGVKEKLAKEQADGFIGQMAALGYTPGEAAQLIATIAEEIEKAEEVEKAEEIAKAEEIEKATEVEKAEEIAEEVEKGV